MMYKFSRTGKYKIDLFCNTYLLREFNLVLRLPDQFCFSTVLLLQTDDMLQDVDHLQRLIRKFAGCLLHLAKLLQQLHWQDYTLLMDIQQQQYMDSITQHRKVKTQMVYNEVGKV